VSIQEKVMAPGTFTVQLNATTTPNSIINSIDPWGQILVHSTRVDENTISNQDMIATARYVGVVQNLQYDLDSFQVSGKGTMVYLGDSDSRGLVVAETAGSGAVRSYTADSLSNVLDRTTSTPYGILRTGDSAAQQAVRTKAGSITNPTTGTTTYTGDHYLESTYRAVKYVVEHFDCEFYVDNEGFIYAGRPEVLFNGHNTNPDAIIIRQGQGEDPNIEGFIPAGITTGFDAEEYVTKVELIPTGATKEVSMADAAVSTNEYKDLFNANLKRIQVVKDASATESNYQARANKALSEYNRLKKTVNVSLEGYDISGSFQVGDKIFIYDPQVGFEDTSSKASLESRDIHQVTYQGSTINPEKIRVVGMSYPVQDGMGVYYRNSSTGVITDLTDYIVFETGDISLEIGDVGQTLSTDFSTAAAVIAVDSNDDFTVPDQPTKPSNGAVGFDNSVGTYRDGAGAVKGFIKLDWTKPQNKNGTTILDGSHFLIQWRMVSDRDGNSILDSNDVALDTSDYQSASVDFDQSRYIIENLNIGFTYTVRLFAFDLKNHSSDVVQVAAIQIPRSSIAPNKPAKPENTFGSLANGLLRAQIEHKLAQVKDDDGNVIGSPINFTLDRDISHLNVYGAKATFNLSYDSTNKKVADSDRDTYYLGMLPASNGNIDLNIPVVGTVNLDSLNLASDDTVFYRISAVNISGRESEPSDVFNSGAASSLIDTQHITTAAITTALIGTAQVTNAEIRDLNVNKLDSGSISGKTITLAADSGTNSTIESSNFSSGSAGFQIKSNGDVEFNGGNFRGDVTGASGTFTGNLSGSTITGGSINIGSGTFTVDSSGNLNASSGTFGGNISANQITADTLNLDRIPTGIQAKLDALSISAGKIANNAIEEAKIAANAVVEAKLANASVSSNKITNASSAGSFGTNGNDLFADFLAVNSGNIGNRFGADNTGVTLTGVVTINPTSGNIGNGNTTGNFTNLYGDYIESSGNIFASGTVRSNSYHSATRYYDINSSSNMDLASSFVYLKPGDNFGLNVSTSTSTIYSTFQPSTNGGKNLGTSSKRWATVFRIAESSTSDERLKENIIDIDYGLDFINDLRPREFTWKSVSSGFSCDVCGQIYESVQECNSEIKSVDENDEEILIDCTGTVIEQFTEADDKHTFGFIAQEMLPELGTSKLYNLVNHDTESDEYNYSQENLIAPLVKAVQELSTQVSDLTARIETLEG